jgi:hypothetical protein
MMYDYQEGWEVCDRFCQIYGTIEANYYYYRNRMRWSPEYRRGFDDRLTELEYEEQERNAN